MVSALGCYRLRGEALGVGVVGPHGVGAGTVGRNVVGGDGDHDVGVVLGKGAEEGGVVGVAGADGPVLEL